MSWAPPRSSRTTRVLSAILVTSVSLKRRTPLPHFGRDHQQLGLIDVRNVPSEDNLADFFTKPLGKTKFQLNVARLGMRSVSDCTLISP